jgi:hypothetical protein
MAVTTNTYNNSTVALGGEPVTLSHAASGTPKGIIGFVALQANQAFVTGATYGGTAMTLVTELFNGSGGHTAVYFLGNNANAGTQTFSVSASGFFGNAFLGVQSINGDANLEIIDWDTVSSASQDDPSVTLSLGGRSAFAALTGAFGLDASNTTPLTSWTSRTEQTVGAAYNLIYTYDTIGTADVTAGVTTSSANAVRMIALAVGEVAASGPSIPLVSHSMRLTMMGN